MKKSETNERVKKAMTNNNKYIEEAKKYYQIALDEIEKSKGNGKIEYAVDGCDKGWLSLNLALKAMFIQKGIKEDELPDDYKGMIYTIRKYGNEDLIDFFSSVKAVLGIDSSDYARIDYSSINACLEGIREFIYNLEYQKIDPVSFETQPK
ncbi:MAG: hypothetical protein HY738_22450 [Bacteroidia bacterium]|nr:hypothetical protein [Bacteroidia bacterium]